MQIGPAYTEASDYWPVDKVLLSFCSLHIPLLFVPPHTFSSLQEVACKTYNTNWELDLIPPHHRTCMLIRKRREQIHLYIIPCIVDPMLAHKTLGNTHSFDYVPQVSFLYLFHLYFSFLSGWRKNWPHWCCMRGGYSLNWSGSLVSWPAFLKHLLCDFLQLLMWAPTIWKCMGLAT